MDPPPLLPLLRSRLQADLLTLILLAPGREWTLSDLAARGLLVRFMGGAVCGQEGRSPADLDVLVIGKPDRDALEDAAQRAGERVAREVNVTIRSSQWWRDGNDGFHAEVTRGPLVNVLGADGAP